MKIFYFTGTGNSLAVAKRIGGELYSIPQEMGKGELNYEDDVIGIVSPVYYGRLPNIVREFLGKAKFKTDYLFAIANCGSGSGIVLDELQNLSKEQGYQFDYLNSIVMVDNFLPVFEIGEEIKKLPEKKTEETLAQIVSDIEGQVKKIPEISAKAKAMAAMAKTFLKDKMKGYSCQGFTINDNCNLCGICTSVCPVANVSVTEKVIFADKCESCYACIHACPQNAIHIPTEKSGKRFRNPEVSLNEIKEANNQNR